MSVDKGGLDYTIAVNDQSPASLEAFRANVLAARVEWAAFKKELQSTANRSRIAAELDKTAAAARAAATETTKLAAAQRQATADSGRRAKAVTDENKAFNKKVAAEEQATRATERNFATQRKASSETLLRVQAEERITQAINKRTKAEAILAANRDRTGTFKATEAELSSLKALTAQEEKLFQAKKKLQSVQGDSDPELQKINAQTEALRRQNKVRHEQLTEVALGAQGLGPDGKPKAPQKDPTISGKIKEFLGLGQAIDDSEKKASKASFTFKRLFTVFAAFTVIRTVIQGFRDLVVETVSVNAEIEKATLGLAAQIGAVGQVFNAQGKLVKGAEALAVAEAEARKQVQLLRLDAINTGQSFDSMLEAFTQALGPGLQAGFNVDQIRQFTKEISIAAKTIGIEGTQLAEEVRSILSGNINPRNTRVAQALGITSNDIKNAKETGTLFQFLSGKFEIYNLAAGKAAKTFSGLASAFKQGVQLILQSGGLDFFNTLKAVLVEVGKQLAVINAETGQLEPNPNLVKVVSIVASGLTKAVEQAKILIATLTVNEVQRFAKGFADLFSLVAVVLTEIVAGATKGIDLVLVGIQFIQNVVKQLTGFSIFDNSVLRTTLFIISAIAGIVLGLAAPILALGIAAKVVSIAFAGVSAGIKVLRGGVAVFKALEFAANSFGFSIAGIGAKVLKLGFVFILVAASARFAFKAMQGDADATRNTWSDAYAVLLVKAKLLGQLHRAMLAGNKEEVAAIRQQFKDIDAEIESNKANVTLTERVFGDFFKSISAGAEQFGTAFSKALKDNDGLILGQSEAIKELKDKLKELTDAAKDARVNAAGEIAAIGLSPGLASQTKLLADAAAKGLKESNSLLREQADIEKQINNLRAFRASLPDGDPKHLEINAKIEALLEHESEIEKALTETKKLHLAIAIAELQAQVASSNFEDKKALASAKIEASHARNLRVFELENNVRALSLEQANKDLELQQLSAQQAKEQEEKDRQANADNIAALEQQRDVLLELQKIDKFTPEDKKALEDTERTLTLLREQKTTLEAIAAANQQIRAEEEKRLENNQKIEKAKFEEPIGAGAIEAFVQLKNEMSDGFTKTLEIMKSAITGFADFISTSIVDAFDPTKDSTVQERFAQFLQQLAQQILSTLITLAITAIALNAASGGLLGPLLQGFATARGVPAGGFHEGGRAGDGPYDHRRRRVFARARGYAGGGRPTARGVHGVERPASGLHPDDKIPLWAAKDEFIVRGREVMRAGADFMDRLNAGHYDPTALRAAAGLDSYRKTVAYASRGQGFITGGPAAAAKAISAGGGGSTSRPSSSARDAVPAYIVGGDEPVQRFLNTGLNGLNKVMADQGFSPNTRR